MSNISVLYHEIKDHIEKVRSIPKVGSIDRVNLDMTINRTCLLLSLDVVLSEYRKKFGTIFNPLNGRDALTHLIVNKYHWTISEVKTLTLEDALLAISEELRFDNLPTKLQSFLESIKFQQYRSCFDDLLDEEWNPNLGRSFLIQID